MSSARTVSVNNASIDPPRNPRRLSRLALALLQDGVRIPAGLAPRRLAAPVSPKAAVKIADPIAGTATQLATCLSLARTVAVIGAAVDVAAGVSGEECGLDQATA